MQYLFMQWYNHQPQVKTPYEVVKLLHNFQFVETWQKMQHVRNICLSSLWLIPIFFWKISKFRFTVCNDLFINFAGFDELTCYCGAEVMYPPIPCGTSPPECHRTCTRDHGCPHPGEINMLANHCVSPDTYFHVSAKQHILMSKKCMQLMYTV